MPQFSSRSQLPSSNGDWDVAGDETYDDSLYEDTPHNASRSYALAPYPETNGVLPIHPFGNTTAGEKIRACKVLSWKDRIGAVHPEDVIRVVRRPPKNAKVVILDVREDVSASTRKNGNLKFNGAFSHPFKTFKCVVGRDEGLGEVDIPARQKLLSSDTWKAVLAADYLVIHCEFCADRSPNFFAWYVRESLKPNGKWAANFAGRSPRQRICLMEPGWVYFIEEAKGQAAVTAAENKDVFVKYQYAKGAWDGKKVVE
ncbi:hypothetical protein JCM10207_007296 [Rhodosporidiobolus poonsookiae]